jgi:ATP-binding cassette subfamily B protein
MAATGANRFTCIEVLAGIARKWGLDLSVDQIVHDYSLKTEPSPRLLVRIAREAGLDASHSVVGFTDLPGLGEVFPLLAILKDGRSIVIVKVEAESGHAIIIDPLSSLPNETYDATRLSDIWAGDVVYLKRRFTRHDADRPFNLWWFVGEIAKQGPAIRDVVAGALAINVIGLVIPLYFQLVVDNVLVHQTRSTLQVLTIGVAIAIIFEALLSFMRGFVLMHAVRKIDMHVATETFRHLLALPSYFFSRSTAGVLTKHMQQSERIREFLTGQSFATFIDLSVVFIVLPLLFAYSPMLTVIVLAFTLLFAAIIAALLIPYRAALQRLYRAEGSRQTLLVESIHAIETIKSMALEPAQRELWGGVSKDVVQRTFDVSKISLWARTLSRLFEQLMSVAIIAVGVSRVFDQTLTVGELIAFQMLAARVSAPLVQLVALIHQYQETGNAVRMLGTIMNAEPERPTHSRGRSADIGGEIRFENVTFSYPGALAPSCSEINLIIPGGTMLGIVGYSGSGKTTLARLIAGLYPVHIGSLRIGGRDLREIDLSYLREGIGFVPQDTTLFRGTVSDNIRRSRPDASIADIEKAALRAGAYDFIERIGGFGTQLEEGAVNLSGGERQRLGIARALLRNPPILIFDEATSALDPASEEVVKDNLRQMKQGRTMIMISHRLSMVRAADNIIVMDRGRIVCSGTHGGLLESCDIYRDLWGRQTGAKE